MKLARAVAIAASTVALAVLTVPAALPAQAAASLPCIATATVAQPHWNQTEPVYIRTATGARVQGYAEYKTTTTQKAGYANVRGHLYLYWDVGHATPGYRVTVVVKVAKGSARGACTTSFVPVR